MAFLYHRRFDHSVGRVLSHCPFCPGEVRMSGIHQLKSHVFAGHLGFAKVSEEFKHGAVEKKTKKEGARL